jgi:DNA-binding CsgD family transcriptional regulator
VALLVAAGYTVLPPLDRADHPQLSAREQQVAALLLDGASNKLIARALDISVHTAKFHVTAVMEKLGARNRADAVSIILREGLIAL